MSESDPVLAERLRALRELIDERDKSRQMAIDAALAAQKALWGSIAAGLALLIALATLVIGLWK